MSEIQIQNPYKSDSGEPLLKRSVVVFMDILGYRALTENVIQVDEGLKFVRNLRNVYDETYKHIRHDDISQPHWLVKGFTDNIVIGYPVKVSETLDLAVILYILIYFQYMMVTHGFFIRGGIAIDDLYMDDEIVFGKGLLEAYNTEQTLARDPRIVLSNSAYKYVDIKNDDFGEQRRDKHFYDNLLIDRDGQIFVNYLNTIMVPVLEGDSIINMIKKHKEKVESNLRKFVSEPAKWSKYFWVANYHNWFCDQYHNFKESHKIDLSKIQVGPSRIT